MEMEVPVTFSTRVPMEMIPEGCDEHNKLKKRFLEGMGLLRHSTKLEFIQRVKFSGTGCCRLQSFLLVKEETKKRNPGRANIKMAWFDESKEELCGIIDYGFSAIQYGQHLGIQLWKESINGTMFSIPDENNMRHTLVCKVICGRMEEVDLKEIQFEPSNINFDSGVDNILNPNRYIIWGPYMNSHICPEYVLSFRIAPLRPELSIQRGDNIETVPLWMRYHVLLCDESRGLSPNDIHGINKYLTDYHDKKLTLVQLGRKVREVVIDHCRAIRIIGAIICSSGFSN